MLEKLQAATDGTLKHSITGAPCRNLIISMPPGSAKSFYSSIVFPTWFIARKPNSNILACSHSADLIEGFSRECRNTVELHEKTLNFGLRADSRSVQTWATTNGCKYRCAGVGAGIAGLRADAGIIDDYIGSQEDADSKTIRDGIWAWYLSDFWPRLKPNSVQIIIATRWHEEDLIGRLLDPKNSYNSPCSPSDWEEIRFPYFAEDNDLLGRPKADLAPLDKLDVMTTNDEELLQLPEVQAAVKSRIWPEWFTDKQAISVLRVPPRVKAGLYQQRPALEQGSYFKREWLLEYTRDELAQVEKSEHRVYGAGDWGVSEEFNSNLSCLGGCIVDENKVIYVLPDIAWGAFGPKELLSHYIDFLRRRNPLMFWSEKGHISKAWGPFLRDMMVQEDIYNHITEVVPAKAKDIRARSIQGLMSMGRVKFPGFAHWWADAKHELLGFPGGKTDDFVDFLAHLGAGVVQMLRAQPRKKETDNDWTKRRPITLAWIKKSDKENKRRGMVRYAGR
jgi:phage terminase large subunit-like protein